MALQDSLEEGYKADYPNDDGGIHPEYCQALHNLLSTYYQDVLGVKGASGVSAPRPLKLRCSDPPLPHGPAAPLPQERRLPRVGRDGNLAEGGQRDPRAHRLQINLVVLDECCAVVCRNRTAIKLSAGFHMLTAFRGTGKSYDMDMQAIARHMTGTCKLMMQFRTRQDTLGNELVYT